MTDHPLDIPDFLRRQRPEEKQPARTIDPYKAECRSAAKTARECRQLMERHRKRQARLRKKRRRAQKKGGAS